MKVLLKHDVPKIGKSGELLEVKEGYARNFLIPRGLAVEATGGTLKQLEEEKKAQEHKKSKEKDEAQALAAKIKGLTITLRHKAGDEGRLFGSITSTEVAEGLKQKGFEIDKKQVLMDDHIRLLGKHIVKIKLHADVTADLNVEVMKPL
jgi:large subunit ribosomal protein L9